MERWIHKLISILVTFLIPFFFILLPYMLHGFMVRQGERGRVVVCHLMCFGGGIFFGTYLLHMGPEVRYILDTALLVPEGITYPVADLVIGAGFFFVLLMEKMIMLVSARNRRLKRELLEQNCLFYQAMRKKLQFEQEKEGHRYEATQGHIAQYNGHQQAGLQREKKPRVCENCHKREPCMGLSYGMVTLSPGVVKKAATETLATGASTLATAESLAGTAAMVRIAAGCDCSEGVDKEVGLDSDRARLGSNIYEITEFRGPNNGNSDLSLSARDSAKNNYKTFTDDKNGIHFPESNTTNRTHEVSGKVTLGEPGVSSSSTEAHRSASESELCNVYDDDDNDDDGHHGHHQMRSLILVMALSLHHLFEGLTIGLQLTTSMLWTLVFAVMCHESIISFSLGLNFVKCDYSRNRHLLASFLVAAIMPVGQAVGIALSETGNQSHALDIASGFLQAFSTGTFLYVTFFEIFLEEINPHEGGLLKVCSAVGGFSVMALLMLVPENTAAVTTPDSTSSPESITSTVSSLLLGYRLT